MAVCKNTDWNSSSQYSNATDTPRRTPTTPFAGCKEGGKQRAAYRQSLTGRIVLQALAQLIVCVVVSTDVVIFRQDNCVRQVEYATEWCPFWERDMSLPVLNTDLFKINADHRGFYRTWYEKDHLRRLGEAHSEGWLSVEDRVGLISDATALAKAGLHSAGDLLDLVHAMQSDTNYHVWVQIVKSLNALKSAWFFGDEKIVNGLDQHFQAVIRGKVSAEGMLENQSLSDDFKRLLLRACGEMGNPVDDPGFHDMIERLKKGEINSTSNPLFSGLLTLILGHGDVEDLEFTLHIYQGATKKADDNEKLAVLETLGRIKKPELVERVLQLPFSAAIKDQDVGIKNPCRDFC